MADIVDRLETVTRSFPKALFIGAGELTKMLTPDCEISDVMSIDISEQRLPRSGKRLCADEEAFPVAPGSVDLIVSLLTLHTANDIVGALIQARQALKSDGLFLAAIYGEGTLSNFRTALRKAEIETTGALAGRIAPFAAIQDFGQALSRAGFAMPVTDTDEVRVTYREPLQLLRDLRGMGETAPLFEKPPALHRKTLFAALSDFADQGGEELFNIVYLTGWAPDASQPRPLKPGSAKTSLADAVKNFEAS